MTHVTDSSPALSIIPHLWFDTQAKEAAEFYCSVFPESSIQSAAKLRDTPSGDADLISFTIWGTPFMAISAGPYFKFNPAISFIVNFDPSRESRARELLDETWNKLAEEGIALMPLGEYPFSKRYGWIQDKYGVTWQLMLTNPEGEPRPTIIPSLLFTGDNYGKAEEARELYLSVFRNSKPGPLVRYPAGMEPDQEGMVMFTDFKLENTWLAAMDSAFEHGFTFNEAISLLVHCRTQEELDHYADKLSAAPEAEQCGWLKDRFGVSWQFSPVVMEEMMSKGTPEQIQRVTEAFLKMKRFDIAKLEQAFRG
ncbi:Glyoxalase superfamily enzyme, possibly 3-demethylubiquinone-9 3-methyltransferase [Paenibacillus sp. UNCCL117]|uniref:VOC family protein n=1 Tax=unclassified Paenibacillus TaxID=185978 RepID=UPI00088E05D3|nr:MULTISPECIES: VOC family protein [unclassified Paenibacillus]SDE68961.1 Glyoxalase superfamily enzyme, possibly 3-demethylubiquinone-9 3-methyltransferase [Paenibacillus sp. cl123]SFW66471.1 Glyoxalase superfamily enzyme, possibly 3-demethylubiquinone-9 3-methyltransferase [Paenibacillus sp. UNCCL117]